MRTEGAAIKDSRGSDRFFVHSTLDDYGLDPYEFRLYGRIVRRAGRPDSDGCFESVSNIAKHCKMSERRVRAARKMLQALNLISVTERHGHTSIVELTAPSQWKTPEEARLIKASLPKKTKTPCESATPINPATPCENDRSTPCESATPPLARLQDKGNPSKGIQSKEKKDHPLTPKSLGWGCGELGETKAELDDIRSYRKATVNKSDSQASQTGSLQEVKSSAAGTLSKKRNQPDWLNRYNEEKPSGWTPANFTISRDRALKLFASHDLGGDLDRAKHYLRLALAMIRVEPEYYSKPTRKGQELHRKTLDFLLTPNRYNGIRPVLTLAEKAEALGLDPDAITSSNLTDEQIQVGKAALSNRASMEKIAEQEAKREERAQAIESELERAIRLQQQQRGYVA